MDNKEFMDLVQRNLRDCRGTDLPEEGYGAGYNNSYTEDDSRTKKRTLGVSSGIFEGCNHIKWGIEIVFPYELRAEQLTLDYLFKKAVRRAYVSIEDVSQDKDYRFASTDLETVTHILKNDPIQLWTPPREIIVPNLKGKKLEEALPILFNTFYERM